MGIDLRFPHVAEASAEACRRGIISSAARDRVLGAIMEESVGRHSEGERYSMFHALEEDYDSGPGMVRKARPPECALPGYTPMGRWVNRFKICNHLASPRDFAGHLKDKAVPGRRKSH